MGAYIWILLGGVVAIFLVAVLKFRLVGFLVKAPVYVRLIGIAFFAASVLVPYFIDLERGVVAFHGFPFLVFGRDEVGRVFSGPISLLSLLGNYLLWTWTVQLVLVRRNRRQLPDDRDANKEPANNASVKGGQSE